jgi:uncharacterized protein YbjT (DUF2867 family)
VKIVVTGGTGLIGSNLVKKLRGHGDEAVPASPDTGVNTLTGRGLDEAPAGADAASISTDANAFLPVRVTDAVRPDGSVVVYLPNGTALAVNSGLLLRRGPDQEWSD